MALGERINDDMGGRGGSPGSSMTASPTQRGGFGSSGKTPVSSAGFRRALMRTGSSSGLASNMFKSGKFSGKDFAKPNYFAQGGRRHGLHIGNGSASVVRQASDAGEDFGGNGDGN
jgi:hypothetical protein